MKTGVRLLFLFVFFAQPLHAQVTYRGIAIDSETREPVELATVKLTQGSGERLINYALTNSKGAFAVTADRRTDSLYISISALGYKTLTQPANAAGEMRFELSPATISLREVVIRPGRVSSRNDTINYSLADFISLKDESVKDVIKKLPGIDVDDSGKISYNGKDITNFYVEGMDLAGGRYNQLSNNLQAKAVDAVQVLENHQPVRMLKDKISVEDVAINLKLKPEFRDKWMFNFRAGSGYAADNPGSDMLWEADVNAMQLSRKSQSSYVYKTNNTGHDIAAENRVLTANPSGRMQEPAVSSFLGQPSLQAPLKQERLLFNDMHTLSANRMYKLGETTQLRLNAGYVHDLRRQLRGSETAYYQPEDTLRVDEQTHTRIRSDQAEISLNLENNADTHYLTNKFEASGLWEQGTSRFSGEQPFTQQIRTSNIALKNELRNLWNKGSHTLELGSLLRYNHLPSTLDAGSIVKGQRLTLNRFYTDNYFSFLRKRGYLTQRYTAGITAQASNVQDQYGAYLTPLWQLNTEKWWGTLSLPVTWMAFAGKSSWRLAINPMMNIRYKLNYAWTFMLSGNYRESYGDATGFHTGSYYTDYRHITRNTGEPVVNRNQSYSLYGEYKNTIREFFTTLSLSHYRNHSNRTYEQLIEGQNIITTTFRPQSCESSGWTLKGTISKGVFDWRMKTSLSYTFGRSKSEMISQGERTPYQSSYMLYEPKLTWNPVRRMEVDYQSSFRYGGSRIGNSAKLTPLWNIVQKLALSYNFPIVELELSADHYYNDVSKEKRVNAFLMDASLRWRSGRWQVQLSASNLLDKRQYGYTQYASTQSYTSWVGIRGREFLGVVGYRW